MFIVIFCCLVILFLYVGNVIAPFLILLGAFCDGFFTNKILRASGYIFNLIAVIGLVIGSVVLAYKLTPEILGYIK